MDYQTETHYTTFLYSQSGRNSETPVDAESTASSLPLHRARHGVGRAPLPVASPCGAALAAQPRWPHIKLNSKLII